MSLSARRAWIEILMPHQKNAVAHVALRKESVDRNRTGRLRSARSIMVALRKESVDRNLLHTPEYHLSPVALRKESVDRKIHPVAVQAGAVASLSARRAWIEKYQWP